MEAEAAEVEQVVATAVAFPAVFQAEIRLRKCSSASCTLPLLLCIGLQHLLLVVFAKVRTADIVRCWFCLFRKFFRWGCRAAWANAECHVPGPIYLMSFR